MKKNFVVILAFLIPLLFLVSVVVMLYVPSLTLSTDYDFVYATCDGDYGDYYRYSNKCEEYLIQRLVVASGQLTEQETSVSVDTDYDRVTDTQPEYGVRIFLHDTDNNASREVTVEEVEALALSPLLTSPDGVSVSSDYNRGAGFFLFFDTGPDYGHYLVKGNNRKKLNLINSDNRYYSRDNFHFVGWVTQ